MVKQCRVRGVPEPEFLALHGEFRAIIARDVLTENVLMKLNLNERQMRAVKYVKEKGQITNKIYQELTGVSKPTSTRDLRELTKKSVLEKYGATGKGTAYRLKGS